MSEVKKFWVLWLRFFVVRFSFWNFFITYLTVSSFAAVWLFDSCCFNAFCCLIVFQIFVMQSVTSVITATSPLAGLAITVPFLFLSYISSRAFCSSFERFSYFDGFISAISKLIWLLVVSVNNSIICCCCFFF